MYMFQKIYTVEYFGEDMLLHILIKNHVIANFNKKKNHGVGVWNPTSLF